MTCCSLSCNPLLLLYDYSIILFYSNYYLCVVLQLSYIVFCYKYYIILEPCVIVSCWVRRVFYNRLIKSQSFRGLVSHGCGLHICFSSDMAFPSLHSAFFPPYTAFPMHFIEVLTLADFSFLLRETGRPEGDGVGRILFFQPR